MAPASGGAEVRGRAASAARATPEKDGEAMSDDGEVVAMALASPSGCEARLGSETRSRSPSCPRRPRLFRDHGPGLDVCHDHRSSSTGNCGPGSGWYSAS